MGQRGKEILGVNQRGLSPGDYMDHTAENGILLQGDGAVFHYPSVLRRGCSARKVGVADAHAPTGGGGGAMGGVGPIVSQHRGLLACRCWHRPTRERPQGGWRFPVAEPVERWGWGGWGGVGALTRSLGRAGSDLGRQGPAGGALKLRFRGDASPA